MNVDPATGNSARTPGPTGLCSEPSVVELVVRMDENDARAEGVQRQAFRLVVANAAGVAVSAVVITQWILVNHANSSQTRNPVEVTLEVRGKDLVSRLAGSADAGLWSPSNINTAGASPEVN